MNDLPTEDVAEIDALMRSKGITRWSWAIEADTNYGGGDLHIDSAYRRDVASAAKALDEYLESPGAHAAVMRARNLLPR